MESLVHELADHPTPAFLENLLRVMKHIVQQWQAEFDWVKSVREEELEVGVENAHCFQLIRRGETNRLRVSS
jgi:hypothetical protein